MKSANYLCSNQTQTHEQERLHNLPNYR